MRSDSLALRRVLIEGGLLQNGRLAEVREDMDGSEPFDKVIVGRALFLRHQAEIVRVEDVRVHLMPDPSERIGQYRSRSFRGQ
jgi:hypothetical protein